MKKIIMLLVIVAVLGFSGVDTNAAPLKIIGTANYSGNDYNLIYDDDQDLIWLDYSRNPNNWLYQENWVSGLNVAGVLFYNLNPGINVSWEGAWRLPSAGGNPQLGSNQTTSEMGHLYYISLEKTAGGPLGDTNPFKNLVNNYYWSGTQYSSYRWYFDFSSGNQSYGNTGNTNYAMPVRPGEVVSVPEPSLMILLCISMVSVAGLRRKWKE